MVDVDTFLTELYVMADDFCKGQFPPEAGPGHPATLSRSEVVTLTMFGAWFRFRSPSDYWRWARRHLARAFPTLPDKSQLVAPGVRLLGVVAPDSPAGGQPDDSRVR